MAVIDTATAGPGTDPDTTPAAAAKRRWPADLLTALLYLVTAGYVTGRLWRGIDDRMVLMAGDQMQFMWFLRHGARILTKGAAPLFTDQLNVPDGVNLMANTSALALTVPAAPLTVLFGPRVAFVSLLVLGLAGTAFAWYFFFSRHLVGNRLAAVAGGGLCGFAPGMVSHANGHVNWTAQFLVPFLLIAVLRLTRPGNPVLGGLVLGLLVTVQAFINEEVLLYTAMACGVFLAAYAVFARRELSEPRATLRRLFSGLGVAALVAGALLAYPLYHQFFGPQAYHGVPGDASAIRADLASFWSFSRNSLAGSGAEENPLALNITEENTFFGWPLLLVLGAVVAWLWRRLLVRAIAATAIVFALLSLGSTLLVAQNDLGVPMPWKLFSRVPLLESAIAVRFGLVLVPLFGALLALAVERLLQAGTALRPRLRVLGIAAVVAALVPIAPVPLSIYVMPTTPSFVMSGAWRAYVPDGYALIPVPDTSPGNPAAMVWLAESNADFKLAGGYFIAPDASGRGGYGAQPQRPTAELLRKVAGTGVAPAVTAQLRQQLRDDLVFWRAAVMVMPDGVGNAGQLARFLDELVGRPGERVADVTVWRTLDLTR